MEPIEEKLTQLARSQSEEIERRQPARLARLQTRIAERGYESDLDLDGIFEASQREVERAVGVTNVVTTWLEQLTAFAKGRAVNSSFANEIRSRFDAAASWEGLAPALSSARGGGSASDVRSFYASSIDANTEVELLVKNEQSTVTVRAHEPGEAVFVILNGAGVPLVSGRAPLQEDDTSYFAEWRLSENQKDVLAGATIQGYLLIAARLPSTQAG